MRSHIFPLFNSVVFSSLYRTHGFERIKRRENYPELGTASYRMVKRFNLAAAAARKEVAMKKLMMLL
jgi:ribosomal protein S18 acetylase RimI-like enzyme